MRGRRPRSSRRFATVRSRVAWPAVLVLLCVTALLALAGCGSSGGATTARPSSAPPTVIGEAATETAPAGAGTGSTAVGSGTADQKAPGVVVATKSGKASYRDISPAELASMMEHKDFSLINVHVPYAGEIAATDLFIDYREAAAKMGELPQDKGGRIVVYCRSGRMSAIAANVWADAGYTEVYNLAGGFDAWEAQGYPLLHLNR
jgi:phage shock protein E